ncbi:MAG: CbtB domain-containing protein [Leptospirales bacterium]
MNQTVQVQTIGTGERSLSLSWLRVLGIFLFAAWIPFTLYLLLFAPLPMVHDAVHPVRHAFSMIMCH